MRARILLAGFLVAACAAALRADSPPVPRFAVPFIDDDYARALKEARARNVPIFVENWAPW